jgi:hypothetical protein
MPSTLEGVLGVEDKVRLWRSYMSAPGPYPADLQHGFDHFQEWMESLADQLGMLVLSAVLKFGSAQNHFIQGLLLNREMLRQEQRPSHVSLERLRNHVFLSLQATLRHASENYVEYKQWVETVGGPLHAHGLLAYCCWLRVATKTHIPETECQFMGKTKYHFLPYTQCAGEKISSFLELHDTLAVVFKMPGPSTLAEWNSMAAALATSFQRHGTVRLLGKGGYTVPWVIRYLLLQHMRRQGIHALELPSGCLLRDLPGPDFGRKADLLTNLFGTGSAQDIFMQLNYLAPPEMFFCYACLLHRRLQCLGNVEMTKRKSSPALVRCTTAKKSEGGPHT